MPTNLQKTLFVTLTAALMIAGAASCGSSNETAGKAQGDPADGGQRRDGATAAGGGSGGKSGAGGTSAAGGASTAGRGGTGGDSCAGVRCASPKCMAGASLYTPPGECCPRCAPDCSLVDCAPPTDCPNGTSSKTPLGQCCPVCESADAGTSPCDVAAYATYFEDQATSLDAYACKVDADCIVSARSNKCRNNCGIAVSKKAEAELSARAESFAESHCAGCPITDFACPPVVYSAVCNAGSCRRVP